MTAEESSEGKMPPNEAESAASTAAATKMDPETEPLNAEATADPKVKFIGGSETVDVEKGGLSGDDGIKPALTKAELMKYATDPFWVKLRWVLFILFWICWTAMLVASIVIIIQAPKCPSPAPKQWWQKRPVYQIDVAQFKDSDSNGEGDLNGVLEKADYLANEIGVGSISLSGILKASDYKNVDDRFGSMEEFKTLIEGMHDREVKVVLEFPPADSLEKIDAMSAALASWLDLGVDGFRVSGSALTSKDYEISEISELNAMALLKEMRTKLDAEDVDSGSKILMTDVESPSDIGLFYGDNVTDQVGSLSQMPVRTTFLTDELTAENLQNNIKEYLGNLPEDAWPNFSLGQLGESRIATRVDPKYINALNMLLMMLPGTPITLYGDEVGITDERMKFEEDSINKRIYQEVSSLRESETIGFGTHHIKVDGDIFILARLKKGNPGFIYLANFGLEEGTVNVKEDPTKIENMADRGILTVGHPLTEEMPVGASIDMNAIVVPPGAALLITFVPDF